MQKIHPYSLLRAFSIGLCSLSHIIHSASVHCYALINSVSLSSYIGSSTSQDEASTITVLSKLWRARSLKMSWYLKQLVTSSSWTSLKLITLSTKAACFWITFKVLLSKILEKEFDPGITHEAKEDWTKTWISAEMKQNREEVLRISKTGNHKRMTY